MGDLKEAGIIDISQGRSGITLSRPLKDITFFDVYEAIGCVDEEGLFHFHENPNAQCPVGRNIHKVADAKLSQVQHAMENEMKKITLADLGTDLQKILAKEA